MSSESKVRILAAGRPRVPGPRSSSLGESGPKARPTGVVEWMNGLIFPYRSHDRSTAPYEIPGFAMTSPFLRERGGLAGSGWLVWGRAHGVTRTGSRPGRWFSLVKRAAPPPGKSGGSMGRGVMMGALAARYPVIPSAEKSFGARSGTARTPNRHRWSGRVYRSERANPGQGTRQTAPVPSA